MKAIQNYVFICVIMSLLVSSCKSMPVSEQKQDFIILNTKDTIYGTKVRGSKWFNAMGKVKVTNSKGKNEIEKVYQYNEIYQIHYYDRKNRKSVVEIVEEYPKSENTHIEMDVAINQGKVKLYYNDPGQMADRPFIVSDIYYGYAHKRRFKKLLNELDKCGAFREKFIEIKERRKRNIKKLIQFYNANCG